MRLATVSGRATVLVNGGGIDVERSSDGRFSSNTQSVYDRWDEFRAFAASLDPALAVPVDEATIGSPVPSPRQVFAIGLNYRAHAEESGMEVPRIPATFTKFPACLSGPFDSVERPGKTMDWEVELVAVISKRADRVSAADAWGYIAGLSVGQDFSERTVQRAAGAQFSLGKSFRGFGPIGPSLVTLDEFADPSNLEIGCRVNGVLKQQSRTNDLIFPIPAIVEQLSAILPLLPGDVIFTGTPAGVGAARKPPEFLQEGDVVESWIEGIGTIRNRVIAPAG